MPFILALGKKKQEDIYEFEAHLVHIFCSRPAKAIVRPYLQLIN